MKSNSLFLRSFVALSAAGSLAATLTSYVQPSKASDLPGGTAAVGQVNILTPSTQNFLLNTNTGSPSTIQYNGSQGQNNNFAVGTGTNFGVSASTSSTPDYAVNSKSVLASDSATLFTNQIGTSGAATASSSYSQSASESASRAQSYAATSAFSNAVQAGGGYVFNNQTYATQAGWEGAWKASSTGQAAYNDAFKSAYTAISNGSQSTTDLNGTISGTFTSNQGGTGSNSQSSSTSQKVYVQDTVGGSYREAVASDFNAKLSGASVSFKQNTSASGTATYADASSTQIAAAAAAAQVASANSSSSNSVVVKGIGATAVFDAASTTAFTTEIKSTLGVTAGGTAGQLIIQQGTDGKISSSGTANGSATGNFGTNSTASSNSATYSSVFYQAF